MLLKIGDIYADVWYSGDGYTVSIIPAEKMIPSSHGFFEMTYAEENVMVNLGPYPDEETALAGGIEWCESL